MRFDSSVSGRRFHGLIWSLLILVALVGFSSAVYGRWDFVQLRNVRVSPSPVQPGGRVTVRFEFSGTGPVYPYEHIWVSRTDGGSAIVGAWYRRTAGRWHSGSLTFTVPSSAGTYSYYLAAYGATSSSIRWRGGGYDNSVRFTVRVQTAAAWTRIGTVTDRLGYTGEWGRYWLNLSSGRTYRFELVVPFGADFDIYIYRVTTDIWGNQQRTRVASGTRSGSANEVVVYTVPTGRGGRYDIEVRSHSGSGTYTLRVSSLEYARAPLDPGETQAAESRSGIPDWHAPWQQGRLRWEEGQLSEARVLYETAISGAEAVSLSALAQEREQLDGLRSRELYEDYLDLLWEMEEPGEYTRWIAERARARAFLEMLSTAPEAVLEQVVEAGVIGEVVSADDIYADLQEADEQISNKEASLKYMVFGSGVHLWVRGPDGSTVHELIPVDRVQLFERIIAFRRRIEEGPSGGRVGADMELLGLARELHELLIAPAEEHLQGVDQLIVVPDSLLYYLPFAALYSCPGCEGGDLFHGGRFLVEDFSLSYVSNLYLLETFHPMDERTDENGFIAFVDPDGSLPEARLEAQGIAELFAQPSLHLAHDATKEAVRLGIGGARHVLFSTHGWFDIQNPVNSYLLMHPTGVDEDDDEQLRTHEVFLLSLQAELVTLSACETLLPALRDEANGLPIHILQGLALGDDVVGLTRAFISAGAQSVLTTHWRVHAESTKHLMVGFYGNMLEREMDKAQALRQAQLFLLREDDSALYRHPYYWAAFTLHGNWR